MSVEGNHPWWILSTHLLQTPIRVVHLSLGGQKCCQAPLGEYGVTAALLVAPLNKAQSAGEYDPTGAMRGPGRSYVGRAARPKHKPLFIVQTEQAESQSSPARPCKPWV